MFRDKRSTRYNQCRYPEQYNFTRDVILENDIPPGIRTTPSLYRCVERPRLSKQSEQRCPSHYCSIFQGDLWNDNQSCPLCNLMENPTRDPVLQSKFKHTTNKLALWNCDVVHMDVARKSIERCNTATIVAVPILPRYGIHRFWTWYTRDQNSTREFLQLSARDKIVDQQHKQIVPLGNHNELQQFSCDEIISLPSEHLLKTLPRISVYLSIKTQTWPRYDRILCPILHDLNSIYSGHPLNQRPGLLYFFWGR